MESQLFGYVDIKMPLITEGYLAINNFLDVDPLSCQKRKHTIE